MEKGTCSEWTGQFPKTVQSESVFENRLSEFSIYLCMFGSHKFHMAYPNFIFHAFLKLSKCFNFNLLKFQDVLEFSIDRKLACNSEK
jgi:hypothetical protein